MSARRLVISGSIPLPQSLGDAGRLQIAVAEKIEALKAALLADQIPLDIELKVVATRPEKKPKPPATAAAAAIDMGNGLDAQATADPNAAIDAAVVQGMNTDLEEASDLPKTTPPWAHQ